MSVSLYNVQFLAIILAICLIVVTIIQCNNYLRNRDSLKLNKILFLCRIGAVLLIVVLFIHPIINIEKENNAQSKLSVYIDTSKSMRNSISENEIKEISKIIKQWSIDNSYQVDFISIGNNVRYIENFDNFVFLDSKTDFSNFRNHVIDNESNHFLLISDGNRPVNNNKKYKFKKRINVIGIGELDKKKQSISKAHLSKVDDDTFMNISIYSDSTEDELELDLYQNNIFLDSYKVSPANQFEIMSKINIDYLELDNYSNLKVILKDSIFNIDSFNVLADGLEHLKPILLISGRLSLNTAYINNKFDVLFDNPLNFYYKINDQWNNKLYSKYDNIGMIVFDNYPYSRKDIEEFQLIMENAEKNSIPIMVFIEPDEDYNLFNSISDILSFKAIKNVTKRKFLQNNRFKYDISKFYITEDTSSFSMVCDENDKNIHYENKSSAICYSDNSINVYYPNIANISYKMRRDGNEEFEKFVDDIFKEGYYKDGKVSLSVKKNKFYNNEEFNIFISNKSELDLDNLTLYAYEDSSKLELPMGDFFSLDTGSYSIRMVDANDNIISNTVEIKIENFYAEDQLKGQDYEVLFNLSKQSDGIYFNYNKAEIKEYLNRIKEIKNNTSNINLYNRIDFKDYLFLLIISIVMLSSEWFIRKRNGLL